MDEELKKEHHRTYTYHFFFNDGLFAEIYHLRDFLNEIDDFLLQKFRSTNLEIEKSNFENPSFNSDIQYEFIFPRILWRTSFLNSYFLLESSLDQICKNIQKAENYNLGLTDISGNGITRSSIYLRKVCNITDAFKTNSWTTLLDYNKLRNVLVHSDGIFSSKNEKLLGTIKKLDGALIDIIDDEILSLNVSKRLTLNSLNIIEEFFNILHKEMKEVLT
jgi:hypothetical protein